MLELRGVTKSYGAVQALRGVDLSAPAGGIFGLVGPNGAGKTTLFSVLCGFLAPDSGTVEVDGRAVYGGKPPPPGTVAILPQDAKFLANSKVGESLSYYARLQGFDAKAAKAEAERVLSMVRLSEVFNRGAETLSHGMYKRVGIAQAFIGDPRLIILDEPTAGLDPQVAREIRGTLRTICENRTVIVSSHNLLEIEDLCRDVAILHKGRIVKQGNINDLKGGAGEVSFRLSERPPEAVVAAIQTVAYVTNVRWDLEAGRLRIVVDIKQKAADAAAGELVAVLVSNGLRFLDMNVGTSLEDRFIDETRD